ncbi:MULTISPECIES: hypothetical protein [Yersinia]|uniref:Uncharacterized protein n=1 Tax=Yersinia frederiksenii TaxID=29484 RepID=A0AAI8ZVD9_YERFR|nr:MULTISPECIES: hypothetical protein [Yersinia]MDN0125574.1 hypothetical protein [Yersinia massiliensis]CFR16203.1 Uncharacterised protein [Yersinia frederiksenii]
MNTIEIKVNVDTAPLDSLITKLERAVELQKQLTHTPSSVVFNDGINIDGCVFSGKIEAGIGPSLASIKELQDNVAAIITNATDTRHLVEQVNYQREQDFAVLYKNIRALEESISRLSSRDSFIR